MPGSRWSWPASLSPSDDRYENERARDCVQQALLELWEKFGRVAVETDPQGHFKVERVPADKYEVTVQLRGFARWIDTIYVAPGVTQVLNVGLPLLRIDDRVAAVVEGGVRDEQGALVPGVTVTAFAVVNPRIVHSTLTQAQGRFSLPIPGGGLYVLSAHKPGFEADARALVIPQRPQSPIAFTLRPLKID